MPYIQITVFVLLLLMHQSCNVALPERLIPIIPPTQPHLSEDWNYPYTKDAKCTFPYIWQASVGRCCYPVFNCPPGYGIEFCSEDKGKDLCAKCKNSSKQYHLVHSFDGVNATCFDVNKNDEDECIVAIKEETLPARVIPALSCGLLCECNPGKCFYGDDPCRCQQRQEECKSNQQMNRLTGACEACPWYSFKLREGCDACIVNDSLWMSRSYKVPVPPSTPNWTVWVITTGYLPNSTVEETNTRTTTAFLLETNNNTSIVIIGVMVTVVFVSGVVIAVCLKRRRSWYARSGTSISFPPIAVANHGPATQDQEESETSHLINNIPETNIQQSKEYIIPQSVSSTHHRLVNVKVTDNIDSPKSSESSNDLGVHRHISERNQSASSNNETPGNLTEPREGTHQIENTDIRNRQENPAEQMEINHGNNNIGPVNNLGITEKHGNVNCSGRQALLATTVTTDLVDLQTGSNAIQIPHHITDNQNKGRDLVNGSQNIVHAEVTDPPSSILFSSDSNNPCSTSHETEKNFDGKIKIQLRKDIEHPDYFVGINQFMRGSPVENSHCWSFPRNSVVADNDSLTVAQTLSGFKDVAQNTVSQAICAVDVYKRTDNNLGKIPAEEFIKLLPLNSTANRDPDPETPTQESGIYSEDSRIPNEEPRVPSEEGLRVSPQHLTMPLSPSSDGNSSPSRPFLNRSISSSTEDEDVAQNTVPQAVCTGDVDKRTDDNISKIPVKEVVRVLPLNSSASRGLHLGTPNQESGTSSEDFRIPNEEPRIHSEEGHPQSPQYLTLPLSPISPSSSSPFRHLFNRSISSSAERPTAKVPPMRQETRSQRQDEVAVENDDSMSTGSSTDISMSYGVIHFAGGGSLRDETLESSNPSLSSHCEDDPPSFSYDTNPPSTASRTQLENTGPRRTRSATRNGSQIQQMANQSRGGPDGASVPSHLRENRVMEPRQVFETEVKEPQQSEETDPKTLLGSTQERNRNEWERQDSDSEDAVEKIGFKVNLADDLGNLRDICEGLFYPGSPSDATVNSSDGVQGKTSRNDFHAMGANASHKEINLRNVPLHNEDQILYNKQAFSSELEHEESKLNSTARSKLDSEETSDSYSSIEDKENIQLETKSVIDSGQDGSFQDSKSSLEEIEKEADDCISDTDPAVEESLSDQRSSHSEDEGVCSNGELNRELQQPIRGQIDVLNEFNSSSLSVNSDESGIDIEEQTIQHLQDS